MTDTPDAYTRDLTKALRPKYGRAEATMSARTERTMEVANLLVGQFCAALLDGKAPFGALNAEWEMK